MKGDFRWPKKGDNPFLVKLADRNSPTWASLHWLASFNHDDSLFSTAFKEAGDKIVKELSRGKYPSHPDMFFMPIAYLYRHSLELKMKHIIRLGIRLELIEKDTKVSNELENHRLHQIWNYVKKVLEKCWMDSHKEELNAASRIIQEFHNIDKSGQNLRYSKDLSGKKL